MTRNRRAWELNDLTVRIVRNMLLHDDVDSLLETGTGTADEAALMVRCYELAAMELWDESALIEAATVAGMDDAFTLSGESPERIHRKISIAMQTNSAPQYMPPPDGIGLLYRLGALVYDELEETVTRFAAIGRYDTAEPQQTPPDTCTATPKPTGTVGPLVTASDSPAPLTTAPAWSLITSPSRAPGYRWPLYQFLKAAHADGKPCPKAREVLEGWKLNKPPELEVMTDGLKYNDSLGNPKEANLKAIQQAIKGLLQKESRVSAARAPDKMTKRRINRTS